ncbi:MAG TPA: squalene--hopene cyclase [Kofleriaceae bacterium]|jgi:squalene-hopene/tetraprenyl-beta-curcumene cyclase|nr:squalene--hopene cyclase [Kofleriaceae bacterium]
MAEREIQRTGASAHDVDQVIARAHGWFRRAQFEDGYWWAELESNATMDAEYVLMTHFLGARDDAIWRGVAQDIRSYQRDDGSWALYPGAPGDLSTTIECYFALRLTGDRGPHLARARRFIAARGGIARARVFTRIWLALCGEWSWDDLPAMPIELMLVPPRAPLSIYRFASWARGTIVPLLILMTDRPVRPVPASASLADLRIGAALPIEPRDAADRVFLAVDAVLRRYHRAPWHPLRARARDAAERWLVDHQEADGSWGGIQPPWVYSMMALHALGYPANHPMIRRGLDGMHGRWMIRRSDGSLRVQACLSPVWDSALAVVALRESGAAAHDPAVQRAARWLIGEEIRVPGDWQIAVPGVAPSGWAFEFDNDLYPDVDDTALVLIGLHRAGALDEPTRARAVAWLLAMQCSSGGWAAFDKDNTSRLPARIPFADFGEMIDPPSADVTAHVVEAFGELGMPRSHPAARAAIDYLYAEQEPDGSWFGRWGVNHLYGTGAVLPALAAAGEPMDSLPVRRAVRWLVERQNPDGGFGEGCESYVDPAARGRGPSTPSQTAWALLALVAAGRAGSPAAERATAYLQVTQRGDGSWDEDAYTGCGFPGYGVGAPRGARIRQGREMASAFLLRYHLYRNCFPLLALGRYRTAITRAGRAAARSSTSYQGRLDAVSRSFAMCIPQLDLPLRDRVALSYLLMRVLDTVEDAPFTDKAEQARQFQRLRGFLRAPPRAAEVDAFIAGFPAELADAERALLGDTAALLDDAHALPPAVRAAMFSAVDRMAIGMAAYARRPSGLRLVDLEDVTRYCCFVAGVVGELLTALFAIGKTPPAPPMVLAYHFGLFLQKVNILKDQQEDEAAGRFLVPDRRELLASLRRDAQGALEYLQALPRSERGYRTFCAWSLMMGAVTVAGLDQPRRSRRDETAELLARTAAIAQDNAALGRLFAELLPELPVVAPGPRQAKPESIEWFRAVLAAPLSDAELRRLGIALRASALAG